MSDVWQRFVVGHSCLMFTASLHKGISSPIETIHRTPAKIMLKIMFFLQSKWIKSLFSILHFRHQFKVQKWSRNALINLSNLSILINFNRCLPILVQTYHSIFSYHGTELMQWSFAINLDITKNRWQFFSSSPFC